MLILKWQVNSSSNVASFFIVVAHNCSVNFKLIHFSTFLLWTFIRALKSLKNCTLMGSFCPKHIICHNTKNDAKFKKELACADLVQKRMAKWFFPKKSQFLKKYVQIQRRYKKITRFTQCIVLLDMTFYKKKLLNNVPYWG